MVRVLKRVGLIFVGIVLFCGGALTISIVNTDTSEARASRLDTDLREQVPPGSSREQLQVWFTAKGFGTVPEVSKPKPGEPIQYGFTLWTDDPAWLSSARFLIHVLYDDQDRILSTEVKRIIVSL